MRRNSRNNAKKERVIMIASSAFVLAALTMTGIYMKSNNEEQQDDGYTLDFTALEDNAEDKLQEIAKNDGAEGYVEPEEEYTLGLGSEEDDLDYMPMEAGSGLVELPGLTDQEAEDPIQENVPAGEKDPVLDAPAQSGTGTAKETDPPVQQTEPDQNPGEQNDAEQTQDSAPQAQGETSQNDAAQSNTQPVQEEAGESGGEQPMAEPERILHFAESDGLMRPVNGEVLIPFSMDSSVYFSTLDQYKYNSAMMIQAQEDTPVVACAEGRVVEIYQNEEIGNAVTMEIGDGYQVTYGQLKDIRVTLNEYVNCGETFASIAAPTKYFCLEGSNLYLRLTANGTPVNPEALFR